MSQNNGGSKSPALFFSGFFLRVPYLLCVHQAFALLFYRFIAVPPRNLFNKFRGGTFQLKIRHQLASDGIQFAPHLW